MRIFARFTLFKSYRIVTGGGASGVLFYSCASFPSNWIRCQNEHVHFNHLNTRIEQTWLQLNEIFFEKKRSRVAVAKEIPLVGCMVVLLTENIPVEIFSIENRIALFPICLFLPHFPIWILIAISSALRRIPWICSGKGCWTAFNEFYCPGSAFEVVLWTSH